MNGSCNNTQGSEENWLITLTTQTEAGMYEDYAKEFQSIFKSFRLLYPVVKEKPEVHTCVYVWVWVWVWLWVSVSVSVPVSVSVSVLVSVLVSVSVCVCVFVCV